MSLATQGAIPIRRDSQADVSYVDLAITPAVVQATPNATRALLENLITIRKAPVRVNLVAVEGMLMEIQQLQVYAMLVQQARSVSPRLAPKNAKNVPKARLLPKPCVRPAAAEPMTTTVMRPQHAKSARQGKFRCLRARRQLLVVVCRVRRALVWVPDVA